MNKNKLFSSGQKYMIFSGMLFTIAQSLIKYLNHVNVFEISFFRTAVSTILCYFILKRKKSNFIVKKPVLLILRSVIGTIAMLFFFSTIQKIPLAMATTIKYTSPIFTLIFAYFFLKERIYFFQIVLILFAFLGVVLMKGFNSNIPLLPFLMGISASILAGFVYILISNIGNKISSELIVFYFMLTGAVICGILMIPFWKIPTIKELIILFLIGILGYWGQLFMTKAFQLDITSKIAPLKYFEIIYTLGIGFIFFNDLYTYGQFLGLLIVVISVLLNIYLINRKNKKELAVQIRVMN